MRRAGRGSAAVEGSVSPVKQASLHRQRTPRCANGVTKGSIPWWRGGRRAPNARGGASAQSNREEGSVNKMLVDDKGTLIICVLGLPPRPHPDDPVRAVALGLALVEEMSKLRSSKYDAEDIAEGHARGPRRGSVPLPAVEAQNSGPPMPSRFSTAPAGNAASRGTRRAGMRGDRGRELLRADPARRVAAS